MSCLCNVKVSNIRPEYNNLRDWCNDPSNVYIGRKGIVFIDGERYPKQDSIWANPYRVTHIGNAISGNFDNRISVLEKYKTYILRKLEDENLYDELLKLDGKRLGCWCVPHTIFAFDEIECCCHGMILMEILSFYNKNGNEL